MTPVELLLDQLPLADAQRWHDEGLNCRLAINSGPERYARAHRLFTFAALLGNSAAKYQLGVMNLRGEGRPKDKLRALMWFKLALARDEPRASGNLSMVAENLSRAEIKSGYRMADDFARAEAAFLRVHRIQTDDAVVDMAELLIHGVGIDPDPELAVAWLKRGIANRHPGAQWLVGLAHVNGHGANQHVEEGMRLLQLSADSGYAKAQYDLAELLVKQPGAANQARAVQLLTAAARQQHLPAMYRLGMLYRSGEVKDAAPAARGATRHAPYLGQALEWLTLAAERGHVEAQYELGQMHAQGLGTRQDFEQALQNYLKAAAQGHAKAQYNLGFLHSHGQGVEQDYAKAYEWYAISEASGYAIAKQNVEYIATKLKPEELELAKWRADSYQYRQDVEA